MISVKINESCKKRFKFYSGQIVIQLRYDGMKIHPEHKENIWGYRVFLSELTDTDEAGNAIKAATLVCCFKKEFRPAYFRVSLIGVPNKTVIFYDIFFESRYAMVDFLLPQEGSYKIEFINRSFDKK